MKYKGRGALVLLLGITVCTPALAQEPVPVTKNYVAWASEFLRAMYPNLNGKGYILTLESAFNFDQPGAPLIPRVLYIGEGTEYVSRGDPVGCCFGYMAQPPKGFHPGFQHPKQFLRASFDFDGHDRLQSYSAEGSEVGNPEAAWSFTKQWRDQPLDADSAAAFLKEHTGAKYGPTDVEQFTKDLPLAKLEPFLGKMKVLSVGFPALDRNLNNLETWPWWEVTATAMQKDGSVIRYKLRFEHFKGDLTDIWADPDPFDIPTVHR